MAMKTRILCLLLLIGLVPTGAAPAEENPIYADLLNNGVVVGSGPGIKLPPPTMADGLDAAGQRTAIEKVKGNRTVEDMIRKSNVTPFELRITDDKSTGANSTVRRVDLWFIAYGTLDKVASEGFWKEALKADAKPDPNAPESKAKMLTAEELSQRQILLLPSAGGNERYGNSLFTLFDKVRISGTMRSLQSKSADSVVAAAVLDARFVNDPVYPNFWRPLVRDAAGKISEGSSQPYSGAASYAKATKLHEPEGALFVEQHLVFDEPAGWFDGQNYLRSKLPIAVQNSVRKFRAKLSAPAK